MIISKSRVQAGTSKKEVCDCRLRVRGHDSHFDCNYGMSQLGKSAKPEMHYAMVICHTYLLRVSSILPVTHLLS